MSSTHSNERAFLAAGLLASKLIAAAGVVRNNKTKIAKRKRLNFMQGWTVLLVTSCQFMSLGWARVQTAGFFLHYIFLLSNLIIIFFSLAGFFKILVDILTSIVNHTAHNTCE